MSLEALFLFNSAAAFLGAFAAVVALRLVHAGADLATRALRK